MDMLCDLSVARAVASRRGGPLTRKARFRPSQAAPFINNQTINRTVIIYAILKNRRLSRPSRFAASGGGRKADK